MMARRVLVTGAGGYLGRQVVERLAELPPAQRPELLLAHDLRAPAQPLPGVEYANGDIRSPELGEMIARHRIDTVVHQIGRAHV